MSSEHTDSLANTITLTFKDPFTLGKDTVAGLREAKPGQSVMPGKPPHFYVDILKENSRLRSALEGKTK